jgi:type I restriction enzyme S subunit
MRFQLDIISNGSTYVAVSVEDVSNIIFPIPPINEQNVITSRIEKITQIIDKLIEKTEYSIITLREYRSALISAAITGKIDVRGSN